MKIDVIESCHLLSPRALLRDRVVLDGVRLWAKVGGWAFYVPAINAKILHSVAGNCHCIHASAPRRDQIFSGTVVLRHDRYSVSDWRRAYDTSVARRAAENCIAAQRLHDAGLGPKVIGCIAVRSFESYYSRAPTYSSGIVVEDLRGYPRKSRATLDQLEAAGVAADRSRSCIRQQIRGYISDLNSVVGVMPLDAEAEVLQVQQQLARACGLKTN
ncbi:MAG: hypothetical protein WD397_04235 [Wenzhouxiangellaceae bacterium]